SSKYAADGKTTDQLFLDTVDFRFRDWLEKKYGSLERYNMKHHVGISSWLSILPPQKEFHYLVFREQRRSLRVEFATRNIRSVIDTVALHGRALVNTVWYCGISVVCALLFNPLAAYALSRYRPRSTYKILLFLMITMAFPPMVTQIPIFLMLRQFHLLNTFAALVLPGLANGYTIFLLKGFFDSLPKELYECAQLDGAGEFRLFWQISMRLSTPILAVTALGAFTGAYTNFMMALLLCQDERMWTIMPWLYQLQSTSGQGVVFASLILASIPTLLVFVLCQKVIMQGIVVPVEK
ncbi:MAG: carbohydrate ABC transporter permease, partial [bacterium]